MHIFHLESLDQVRCLFHLYLTKSVGLNCSLVITLIITVVVNFRSNVGNQKLFSAVVWYVPSCVTVVRFSKGVVVYISDVEVGSALAKLTNQADLMSQTICIILGII